MVFLEYGGPAVWGPPFSYDIIYIKRDLLTDWGSEVTVQTDIPFKSACPGITLNEGFVRIFWLNDPENYISYKRIDSDGYLSRQYYLVDETTDTFENAYVFGYDGLLNPFVKLVGGKFGMLWVTKASSPYTIKFGLQNFSYECEYTDTRIFDAVKANLKKAGKHSSFNVTRLALTLGDRDATTGQYAQDYAISTIQMVLLDKDNQRQALELGYFVQLDAVGFTTDLVRVYDRIQDGVGRTWLVQAVKSVLRGNIFNFYVCDLKEMALYVE